MRLVGHMQPTEALSDVHDSRDGPIPPSAMVLQSIGRGDTAKRVDSPRS